MLALLGASCSLHSKGIARCALSIRAAVLEPYQYRCSKSADSRALSNTSRCFFIKFSVKENLKRTANRIVYVKSNLPVCPALCRGTAPLGAEVVPRSVQRYCPARGRGTAPLGVEVLPRSGCGCIPRSRCGGIPRARCTPTKPKIVLYKFAERKLGRTANRIKSVRPIHPVCPTRPSGTYPPRRARRTVTRFCL